MQFGVVSYRRLAAAQEAAAQQRAGRDLQWTAAAEAGCGGMGHPGGPHDPPKGPSSLFLFSEENIVRRYTRFIIEWPYPLLLLL
ncbi:hypothetical protein LSTR_LSTR011364 [Laodelphax striatellus]|uniref:Uncharacterized protein n=1 Tax=Laodelphax striatellus TaxID=195883 RepID=A0A482WWK9_LAOST|nr:hypothetical protein LSTR_LSTR011364 [Laodelphax striatellus]